MRRPSRVRIPVLTIHDSQTIAWLDGLPTGDTQASFSLSLVAPVEKPVKLRNVVGLLRGSDPKLKETYVLVTAHYDHLGRWPTLEGDQIYNGANDDASGTASVIELAQALATPRLKPRRSVVFLTFFGEESGLLGSRFYAKHPVVPLDKTVVNLNLEQVGRTDDSDGTQVRKRFDHRIRLFQSRPILQGDRQGRGNPRCTSTSRTVTDTSGPVIITRLRSLEFPRTVSRLPSCIRTITR